MKDKSLLAMLITVVTCAAVTYFTLGQRAAIGAVGGGGIGVANWLALRWITQHILTNAGGKRSAASIWLLVKFIGLAVTVWFLLAILRLDLVGFVIGLGASLLGMLLGANNMTRGTTTPTDTAPGGQRAAR